MSNHNSISPILNDELKFLIACCQTELRDDDINEIQTYLSYLNDEQIKNIITFANQHGILPLVHKALKNLSKKSLLPVNKHIDTLLTEAKNLYMSISQRNMLMSAELIRIIQLLEKNNIEALAFKGPALSQMAYGDITLRQYSDLDILVDEKDLYKAGEIISSNNYIPDVELDFLTNEALLDVSSDLGFRHEKNNTYIELHWKLFRKKLSVTLDGLNVRSNPSIVKIQGKEIKTLQSDLLLVYLCAHGSKHMWERIEWIVDVDRLIVNLNSIDWDMVWHYAKEMHSVNTLLLGLSLCKELFGTDIPDMIKEEINKRQNIQTLKTYTLELLNGVPTTQSSKTSSMFKKFDYHSKLYDSSTDKVKYYLSSVFKITPDDILYINLPKHLSFLYFIIRPFRLTQKYIKKSLFRQF